MFSSLSKTEFQFTELKLISACYAQELNFLPAEMVQKEIDTTLQNQGLKQEADVEQN